MSAKEYDKLSDSEKKKEDWMNSKWRPMMGWTYMITCIFDFVIAPILWSLLQALSKGQVNVQWQPLTLQGAGLFHIAMGAVLGIAAYGRTQEKLGGANNGGIQMPANVGTTYVPPSASAPATPPAGSPGGFSSGGFSTPPSSPAAFGQTAPGGFGTTSPGYGAVPPASAGGFPTNSFGAAGTVQAAGFATPAQPTGRISPKTGRELISAPHEDIVGPDGEPLFGGDPENRDN